MEKMVAEHLRSLYGLNPNIPHLAFQFPRIPPDITEATPNTMFKSHENPTKRQMIRDAETVNQKLQGFQHMYRQHAAGLLTMNSPVIPPGHPAYTRQNSIQTLQTENDRLLKENLELQKKLETKKQDLN